MAQTALKAEKAHMDALAVRLFVSQRALHDPKKEFDFVQRCCKFGQKMLDKNFKPEIN